MSVPAILAPVFVQVALSFALLLWLGGTRVAAVRDGAVRIGDVALGERAWPARPAQAANAFANQFELPVLFYALVPLAFVTRKADLAFVLMSWVFVLARIAQAGVAVTTNHVPTRFRCYLVGALVLLAMWIVFAIRILASEPVFRP